jgi:hypothetical protein
VRKGLAWDKRKCASLVDSPEADRLAESTTSNATPTVAKACDRYGLPYPIDTTKTGSSWRSPPRTGLPRFLGPDLYVDVQEIPRWSVPTRVPGLWREPQLVFPRGENSSFPSSSFTSLLKCLLRRWGAKRATSFSRLKAPNTRTHSSCNHEKSSSFSHLVVANAKLRRSRN